MSQKFSLYEALTVDQNIRFFGAHLRAERRAVRGAPEVRPRDGRAGGREHTQARELAGGWRQRLALGCAILHEPPIVFLDEPTGGVDPLSRRQFWRLIEDCRGRASRARHHALSRRGGALPSHRDHSRRQAGGDRHVARAEAGLRRSADRRNSVAPSGRRDAGARRHGRRREDEHLRHRRARGAEAGRSTSSRCAAALAAEGLEVDVQSIACRRRSRTCSSTSSSARSVHDAKALAVGRKEFRQIARDRRTLLILLFVPAFFLLLYGYALNFDMQHIRLAVEDRRSHDGQPRARLGLRQLRLLRSRRLRRPATRATNG